MTANQLQRLLDRMGETQVGMARKLGISDRNMRRYVAGELPVPCVVEIAVRCLAEHSDSTDVDCDSSRAKRRVGEKR